MHRIPVITSVVWATAAVVFLTLAPVQGADLPPDSAYVTVDKEGHLVRNGERLRFWGAIGSMPRAAEKNGDMYYGIKESIRRIKKMGFNMVRDWSLRDCAAPHTKGDGSRGDQHDFFIAECAKEGLFIWAPSICAGRGVAVAWDPQLEANAIAGAVSRVNHVNVHNGLKLADDPTIVIWELSNEQWWMTKMLSGDWQRGSAASKKLLLDRWTEFLTRKYENQDKLIAAWGFLFPGEDLAKGTVLLAPTASEQPAARLNDSNPEALAKFQTIPGVIGRDQCTAARGGDVIEFFLQTIIGHKKRCEAALKACGKSVRLSPMVFDTGIGQSIGCEYMQMQGDAIAQDCYQEGGNEAGQFPPYHKRWPFYSTLDSIPQLGKDVPWLEQNKILNKPFLVYETQMGAPNKYRAEWPLLIAATGIIQDWDAACYHYWAFPDVGRDRPYAVRSISRPGAGATQYHYTSDEVEMATIRAGGAILRNSLCATAAKPTLFTYGAPALRDPRMMDYGGDYGGPMAQGDMQNTAFTYGMRLMIDPNQKEFVKIQGPVARLNGFDRIIPLKASPQIQFDYNRGHLIFDAPGVASYTGFFSQYGSDTLRFANGVEVRQITHVDPPDMPFPGNPEKYMSFTLASEDGKPLDQCRQAVLVLVSANFNSGTRATLKPDGKVEWNYGSGPVLTTRVSATVSARQAAGMRYRMIDFEENVLSEGTVGPDGILNIPADKPIWLTELTR